MIFGFCNSQFKEHLENYGPTRKDIIINLLNIQMAVIELKFWAEILSEVFRHFERKLVLVDLREVYENPTQQSIGILEYFQPDRAPNSRNLRRNLFTNLIASYLLTY